MILKPNVILVCGAGRKVGKTTLVCKLIAKFAKQQTVIAVKISPHTHDLPYTPNALINKGFRIIEETDATRMKDSNLFLKLGASQSFYIEAYDEHVWEAFQELENKIHPNTLIICESGVLAQHIQPRILIFMDHQESLTPTKQAYKNAADVVLTKNDIDNFIQQM